MITDERLTGRKLGAKASSAYAASCTLCNRRRYVSLHPFEQVQGVVRSPVWGGADMRAYLDGLHTEALCSTVLALAYPFPALPSAEGRLMATA